MNRLRTFGLVALLAILAGSLSWLVLGSSQNCTIEFGFAGEPPTQQEVAEWIERVCPDESTREDCLCRRGDN